MNTRALNWPNILLGGGVLLMLAGIVVSYTAFAPYRVEGVGAATGTVTPSPTAPLPPATATLLPLPDPARATAASPLAPSPTPVATPTALPTPVWQGQSPAHLTIPAIALDAPITPIGWITTEIDGQMQAMWDVPDSRAVGWHETSAYLGVPGNTVFNGHNTSRGQVFRHLYKLEPGDTVIVAAEDGTPYPYEIAERLILPEAGQPLEVRQANARYTLPTADERLTLVTCHPYGSLAYRLILIAYPVPAEE